MFISCTQWCFVLHIVHSSAIHMYFRYENGEEEHCLELWNRDGKVKKKYNIHEKNSEMLPEKRKNYFANSFHILTVQNNLHYISFCQYLFVHEVFLLKKIIIICLGSAVEWHPLLLRNILHLWSLKTVTWSLIGGESKTTYIHIFFWFSYVLINFCYNINIVMTLN